MFVIVFKTILNVDYQLIMKLVGIYNAYIRESSLLVSMLFRPSGFFFNVPNMLINEKNIIAGINKIRGIPTTIQHLNGVSKIHLW